MDFRYRWRNGAPPNRDAAMRDYHLLDEDQFNDPRDQQFAEEMARKRLGLPLPVPGDECTGSSINGCRRR